jgi:uncharacterized glyoxalase superfamily protein PhnB
MRRNRSVPPDTLLPHLTCLNVDAAVRWLTEVFGFTEHYRYGDPANPSGAQLHLGNAWIMVNAASPGRAAPATVGACTQTLTIFFPDPETVTAQFEKVKNSNANIVEALHETEYGELQFGVVDPDGHRWLFACHARDVNPPAWGATLVNPV